MKNKPILIIWLKPIKLTIKSSSPIISNFVDPTSQGITDDGIINSIVSETAILLRHSGSSVTMIGLIYENQPYFNLISGSYDYNE